MKKTGVFLDEKSVGLLMNITGVSMKNHGFLMEKRGVFDEKAGMSQHAVFWNSQSGKFQAQSLCGGP